MDFRGVSQFIRDAFHLGDLKQATSFALYSIIKMLWRSVTALSTLVVATLGFKVRLRYPLLKRDLLIHS